MTASTSWWWRSASSPSARPCGSPPTCGARRPRSSRSASPGWARKDWKRSWKPWLRGTAFGFPFGVIPAGGAEIPTFLSYITEKQLTKHPEEFGKGAIEGVAGPEAANNASAAGTLVPMLSLGLPTNATAAVMLAALTSYGIQPGPLLLQRESGLVWALIASLFIGNTLLLVLNLPLAPAWAKLLRIPRPYLYAGILFFASMGAYAVNAQPFDLILLLVLGLIGFGMRRFGLPVLPLIVGVILGPRVELQGRRALQLSSGDLKGLFGSVDVATGQFVVSAIAIVVYVAIVIVLLWPLLFALIKKLLPARAEAAVEQLTDELHHDLDTDRDGHPLATVHGQAEMRLPAPVHGSASRTKDPQTPPPSSASDQNEPDATATKEIP